MQHRAGSVDYLDVLLDLLFPPVCLGCRVLLRRPSTPPLCTACAVSVAPLPATLRSVGPITALYPYDGPLAHALTHLKYHGDPSWAGPLGALLSDAPELVADPSTQQPWDAIVPIPLHWHRLLARGFNQALLLARAARGCIARHRRPALWPRALRRCRPTPRQAELDAMQRRNNLRDAFVVGTPNAVPGKRLLLVDDVTTTGATVDAARGALLQAGAAQVGALTLLRTLE